MNAATIPQLYGAGRSPVNLVTMPMPESPEPKSFLEVELVRLFTDKGHPLLGLAALAMRTGVFRKGLAGIAGLATLVIAHFL